MTSAVCRGRMWSVRWSGHWDVKYLARRRTGWKSVGRLVGRSVGRESPAACEEGVVVVGHRTDSHRENKNFYRR